MPRARAIVVTAKHCCELREFDLPDPADGECLVRVSRSTVSPGTELRVLDLQQHGMPDPPLVPGYAAVGTVLAGERAGERVAVSGGSRHLPLGRCWGAHCSHLLVPADALTGVPDAVSDAGAACVKLASIAMRGVRLARVGQHTSVTVVGLGPIGQFSARIAVPHALSVVGRDLSPARRRLAAAAGVDVGDTPGGSADVVIDATGSPAALPAAVAELRDEPWVLGRPDDLEKPTLVVQGSYVGAVPLPYDDLFQREATVLFPRDEQPADRAAVLAEMAAGRLRVDDLVTHVADPAAAEAAYAAHREAPDTRMLTQFDWA